jgi:SAM-dependent methyltransferase
MASGPSLPTKSPAVTQREPEPRVVMDAGYGYRRLDPLPIQADLDGFYQSAYVDLVRTGSRFPEMCRLLGSGEAADEERRWLQTTFHKDVLEALDEHAPANPRRLLVDIGCGIGELIASAGAAGWEAIGLEPSRDAAAYGVALGRTIVSSTLESYLAAGGPPDTPQAASLVNVLEHIRDPMGLLRLIHGMLAPSGALIIRVPNDFNPLQEFARSSLRLRPWWIATPDHVNYFDHRSIGGAVEAAGYRVVDQWADFPMELFLLMGDDYVTRPEVGPGCHARRRLFEERLDSPARRAFGRALVPLGWGRNSIVVAVRPVDP